ncbi:MAG: prepilin-type N-terminal cleavage/methylation domain-containing protein [Chloroflexi bacterium]|nr:prepilin-type N-terminal cleavage/methylation domain-containing protein [Chloroflexota bacterium]
MMAKRSGLFRRQEGFSLVEVVIAIALVGIVVTGLLGVMAATSRASVRAEESVTLLQLARAQIEAIQQSPFKANAAEYPSITGIPEGFTVAFTAADSGIAYTYPAPLGTTITGEVQRITVTAQGDFSQMSLTFYKVRLP